MKKKEEKKIKQFPKPLPFKKLLGPSFIILALGLGSGEIILWPYLASNYGLGIVWGALLGITFQYFINMEIERYALIKGESVFVGLAKLFSKAPYWFIASTFLGFGLPGIIAASAQVLAVVFGLENFKWLAMGLLVVVGLILSLGKSVYVLLEHLTKRIIIIGIPFIFLLTIYLAKSSDWQNLFNGFIGKGDGYWFLPAGISLVAFLAAFAYSGAGGNLNLTQSIYIREKGYGMGKYSQKISGLFHRGTGHQEIKLSGENFSVTPSNIKHFRIWWRQINFEHLIVFWFLGLISICLLMLLSYSSTFHLSGNDEGIVFVLREAVNIGRQTLPWLGTLFLLAVAIMLFQTQLGVMDSTSRIMSENYALKKYGAKNKIHLAKIYSFFVWSQIVFGLLLFSLNIYEPWLLIVVGAVINAVAMFVHIGLVHILNKKSLPKVFQPPLWRKLIILLIFLFFGVFSFITIISKF